MAKSTRPEVFYEVEEAKDLGFIDNHGHGDDYSVSLVYAFKYSPRRGAGAFSKHWHFHKAKKARFHYEYFNYSTYETKRSKEFENEHGDEAQEILEKIFDKLNKVPIHD